VNSLEALSVVKVKEALFGLGVVEAALNRLEADRRKEPPALPAFHPLPKRLS
jgi:hypothetical protein